MRKIIEYLEDAIRELKIAASSTKAEPLIRPSKARAEIVQAVAAHTAALVSLAEEETARIHPEIEAALRAWEARETRKQDNVEEDPELRSELEQMGLDEHDILLLLSIAGSFGLIASRLGDHLENRMLISFKSRYVDTITSSLETLNLKPSDFKIPDTPTAVVQERLREYARPALRELPRRLARDLGDHIATSKTMQKTAKEIANSIRERLSPSGRDWRRIQYQFERIARTEISAAASKATLEASRQMGAMVMYMTMRDSRVCSRCRRLDGKMFQAGDPQIETLIPMHPNCRCVWVPIGPGGKDWLRLPRASS